MGLRLKDHISLLRHLFCGLLWSQWHTQSNLCVLGFPDGCPREQEGPCCHEKPPYSPADCLTHSDTMRCRDEGSDACGDPAPPSSFVRLHWGWGGSKAAC